MKEGEFSVVVTFKLKPGSAPSFTPMMIENAEASVRDEAGCLQFHVARDEADPDTIWLYEVYDNAASFDAHLQAPHFLQFSERAGDLIEERIIQRCTVLKT